MIIYLGKVAAEEMATVPGIIGEVTSMKDQVLNHQVYRVILKVDQMCKAGLNIVGNSTRIVSMLQTASSFTGAVYAILEHTLGLIVPSERNPINVIC